MLKRLIPLSALLFISYFVQAQVPEAIHYFGKLDQSSAKEMICNNAGTVKISLGNGVQTNDPIFLCYGDSILIDHQGDQILTGDPNPLTTPGIGYAFYKNVPTIDGPTLNSILFDPSILDVPSPPGGLWVATGSNPNGDMYFVNNGSLQLLFNVGKPVQIWFAPITLDNWATKTFEGTPAGSCVNVNINQAFPVVYLNKISASSVGTQPLVAPISEGSFIVNGGWPEFSGAQNYTITVQLKSNPLIKGTVTSGIAKSGSLVKYTVPQDGTYVVTIDDGKTCTYNFEMKFPALTYNIGEGVGYQGDTVCIPVTVDNWNKVVGHTLYFTYDHNVVQFVSGKYTNPGDFLPPQFQVSPPDTLIHLLFTIDSDNGVSVPDGSVLFTLCFKLIGNPLDCSDIKFDSLSQFDVCNVVVTDGNFNLSNPILNLNNGKICILPPNTGINLATSVVEPLCNGSKDGSIDLKVIGGIAPYNYSWTKTGLPPNAGMGTINVLGGTSTISGLNAGTYHITVTDSDNPQSIATVDIILQEPNPITVNLNAKNPTCSTTADGTIDITLTNGGTGPYTYVWNPPAANPIALSFLPNGIYNLTVTDNNNCTASFSQTLNTTAVKVNFVSLQNLGCGSPNGGSITVNTTGGTSPYDYLWSNTPPSMTATANNLAVGAYTVTSTDAEGCTATFDTTIISVPGILITGFDSVSILCGGVSSGSLTVLLNIPAGASVTNYNWAGPTAGSNMATISGLSSGTYYVTVTDDKGCMSIDSAYLSSPLPLAIQGVIMKNPVCPGDLNGSVGVSMTGGTMPYKYIWSTNPGNTTFLSVIPNLGAGTYAFTITDANGCGPLVKIIDLVDPPKIVNTFSNIEPTGCFTGTCDGGAQVDVNYSDGTTGKFNITWASGESDMGFSSSTAFMLCQGFQTVTISDANCGLIDSVFISTPAAIVLGLDTLINVSCLGLTDGSVKVNTSGGSPGYSYQWSFPGSTTNSIGNLPAGDYFVKVYDKKGCSTDSLPFTITEPQLMQAFIDTNNTKGVTCANDNDGRIGVYYIGGNFGNATYTWSPNVSTSDLAVQLPYGTYNVTITDPRGCTDSASYTISAPPAIFATIPPILEPDCFGYQTFATVTTASGGSGAPYTFAVDNGPNVAINEKIPVLAGDHLITVFDKNGCTYSEMVSVTEPAPIVVNLGPDVQIQLGDSLQLLPFVSVSAVDSFKWAPIAYVSEPNTLNTYVKPVEPTTFTLKVWDATGCYGTDDIFIDVDNNRNVFIPNVFSPNGDGINDKFNIGTGQGVDRINYMQIYDRWGELIFEAKNIIPGESSGSGWDGKFKDQYMNTGVYIYLIEVKFLDNVSLLYRGDVTLMR